LVTSAAFSHG